MLEPEPDDILREFPFLADPGIVPPSNLTEEEDERLWDLLCARDPKDFPDEDRRRAERVRERFRHHARPPEPVAWEGDGWIEARTGIAERRDPRPDSAMQETCFYSDAAAAKDRLLTLVTPESREPVLELLGHLLRPEAAVAWCIGPECSRSVRTDADEAWRCRTHDELVREIFAAVSRRAPDMVESLAARAGLEDAGPARPVIDELRRRLGDLELAGLMVGWCGHEERARMISDLLRAPAGNRQSRVFEALLHLPVRDLVTTNFDDNLLWFLQHHPRTRGIPLSVIGDIPSLEASYRQMGGRRLIHVHGRCDPAGSHGRLVVDDQDYAELDADVDGVPSFVTRLFGGCHVVYIGYELSDPSFVGLERRVHVALRNRRPPSFAFVARVLKSERECWRARNLLLVEIGEAQNLPEIISLLVTIWRFVDWAAKPHSSGFSESVRRARTELAESLRSYSAGRFPESLRAARSALAASLFWAPVAMSASGEPVYDRQDAEVLLESLVRLALCHIKLQFAPGESEPHAQRLQRNLDQAYRMIESHGARDGVADPVWDPYRNAVDLVKGRRLYDDQRWIDARDVFRRITARTRDRFDHRVVSLAGSRTEDVRWHLKAAETHFYATCQLSRIDYQLLEGVLDSPAANRKAEAQRMVRLADEIDSWVRALEVRKADGAEDAWWAYYHQSLSTIGNIAQWTASRHAMGLFRGIIPLREERLDTAGVGYLEHLNESIRRLEVARFPVGGGEPATLSNEWMALRYRYLARALALRRLVNLEQVRQVPEDEPNEALWAMKMARDASSGPGLERQRVLNELEDARLGILLIYRNLLAGQQQHLSLDYAAFHLDAAFVEVDRLAESGANVRWLDALRYHLAAYFALIVDPDRDPALQAGFRSRRLGSVLFDQKTGDRVREVVWRYKDCAPETGSGSFASRVRLFETTFEGIRRELESGSAAGSGALRPR